MLIRAWVDGGARGNPGPAGYGVLMTDADGTELVRRWGFIGENTNNVAEYQALVCALEQALEIGAQEIEVHTDSELIQRQVTGVYKVRKAHLLPLFKKVRALSAKFDRFEITHVRRENNREADALANRAMDEQASGCELAASLG